ncbi:MAG: hypothetical protein ACREQQ_04875 [Candidatus Binatia bacterium]
MNATRYAVVILLASIGAAVVPAIGLDDPPHTREVSPGMFVCDDGYDRKLGPSGYHCTASADEHPGPKVIISDVPWASDDRGQTGCPPGGCAGAIPQACRSKWPSDYAMQARCLRQQTKALDELEGKSETKGSRRASRRGRRR